jgi:hypothetical protein
LYFDRCCCFSSDLNAEDKIIITHTAVAQMEGRHATVVISKVRFPLKPRFFVCMYVFVPIAQSSVEPHEHSETVETRLVLKL